MLNIFVLFLDDLVTRQHYEMFLINNSDKELDEGPSVVEVRRIELS